MKLLSVKLVKSQCVVAFFFEWPLGRPKQNHRGDPGYCPRRERCQGSRRYHSSYQHADGCIR